VLLPVVLVVHFRSIRPPSAAIRPRLLFCITPVPVTLTHIRVGFRVADISPFERTGVQYSEEYYGYKVVYRPDFRRLSTESLTISHPVAGRVDLAAGTRHHSASRDSPHDRQQISRSVTELTPCARWIHWRTYGWILDRARHSLYGPISRTRTDIIKLLTHDSGGTTVCQTTLHGRFGRDVDS
jgi:hypothetical protein